MVQIEIKTKTIKVRFKLKTLGVTDKYPDYKTTKRWIWGTNNNSSKEYYLCKYRNYTGFALADQLSRWTQLGLCPRIIGALKNKALKLRFFSKSWQFVMIHVISYWSKIFRNFEKTIHFYFGWKFDILMNFYPFHFCFSKKSVLSFLFRQTLQY